MDEKFFEVDKDELPRTFMATWSKHNNKAHLIDMVEIYFDRLNLDDFRHGSGNLNRRHIARHIIDCLNQRNAERPVSERIHIPKLRTIENVIQHLLDYPDEG